MKSAEHSEEKGEEKGMKFNEVPFIRDHLALYKSDPEKAHMWDSTAGGRARRRADAAAGPRPVARVASRAKRR